jgi:hypothetical protein
MTKLTIANIKPGQFCHVGSDDEVSEFIGFSTSSQALAPLFLGNLYAFRKEHQKTRNSEQQYAWFNTKDPLGEYCWAAYYWNGKWRVGTSAGILRLRKVNPSD